MSNDILTRIIECKKQEIRESKAIISEKKLCSQAFNTCDRRPFIEKFKLPGINIIAEIKRASPSKGPINMVLDPAFYAKAYEKGGAVALSVLTEKIFFKGSPQDLEIARAATSLPVLRKDFIISEYQMYETVLMGADAVLLIVRCLSEDRLKQLIDLSRELKLETLVEIHTESDLERATTAGAQLIGINNRNLQTFETNLATAMQLVSLLKEYQMPVAASGIGNRKDIENNLNVGINNFLIGESLVKADDPVGFLLKLRGEQQR
ncbi:MAG: indole-3-glycerol phosphate synthase TrpC [Desulfobacterales bacterium]